MALFISYYCGAQGLCPSDQICNPGDGTCVLPGEDTAFACPELESEPDNTPGQDDFEAAAMATRNIYATPTLLTAHRLATLDLRAPLRPARPRTHHAASGHRCAPQRTRTPTKSRREADAFCRR